MRSGAGPGPRRRRCPFLVTPSFVVGVTTTTKERSQRCRARGWRGGAGRRQRGGRGQPARAPEVCAHQRSLSACHGRRTPRRNCPGEPGPGRGQRHMPIAASVTSGTARHHRCRGHREPRVASGLADGPGRPARRPKPACNFQLPAGPGPTRASLRRDAREWEGQGLRRPASRPGKELRGSRKHETRADHRDVGHG
jgi:hypothetical protein